MKTIILSLVIVLAALQALAQTDTTTAGNIMYYEGKVELGKDPTWVRAKIKAPVKRNQWIKTSPEAMVEIKWLNGTTSVVGPNTKVEVKALAQASNGNGKSATEGVFGEFMNVFKSGGSNTKSEEGGVRRDDAEQVEPDEVYWKREGIITFEQAFSVYEQKSYTQAIPGLHAYIDQNPKAPNTKYAYFALGHCYIMANNPIKAKEIFKSFVIIYANDPLKTDAEKVLELLQ
jgi:TolA-binding protein